MAVSMVKMKKPFDMLANWDEYVRVVNQFFSEQEETQVWAPPVDVKEKDGNYLLRVDLPGVREEDIHVIYKNGFLTIKGNRIRPKDDEGSIQDHMIERYYGRFERVLRFPPGINADSIKKEYKDGILKLTIPVPDDDEKKNSTTA